MSYKQLTQEQRYQIYALKQAEQQSKRIAEIIGVHASTISRELKTESRTRKVIGRSKRTKKHKQENMEQRNV